MEKIRFDISENQSVARVILDDGKGNVLDSKMMRELSEVLRSFSQNRHLKIITVEGAGKHFSFGASVEEHKKEHAQEMLSSFHKLFYAIFSLSVPVVAKISGQCLGGGMELALACNLLFADKTARLGQPEIVLGVFAPPASVILPLKIGSAKAEEILLSGRILDPDEAHSIGILNKVYDSKEQMHEGVIAWIREHIIPKSASSLRYAVRAARIHFADVVSRKLPELEELYVKGLMETEDANEGILSFLEKRNPVWSDQ